jgi:RND superfamily putative drug exporter
VFGSFVLNGDPTVKQFGIGLAVAVILDATVVRCLLVPARMASLGKANWCLPRWLGRILPRISIEGEEYFKTRDQSLAAPQLPAPEPSTARS